MLLSYSDRKKAIQYNRGQGLDDELVKKIQTLVGTEADGDIGKRTVEAVALWQQANGLKPDGKIGPKTLKEAKKAFPTKKEEKEGPTFLVEPEAGFEPKIIDRRVEGGKALRRKSLDTNRKFQDSPRSANGIDGIVLHQMGFSRGDDVQKYDKVTAHFIITPAGEIAQLHDITAALYSSNYLNRTTMAVEFAGNLRDDKGKFHGDYSPNYLTPKQVAAGRYLLKHVKDAYKINKAFAHRQATSARRTNCCGPEIWRSVAEYAIGPNGLGFEDTAGATFGDGAPIPESWRK